MGSASPIAFLKQSIKEFRTVGAVAPSSMFLARGIARKLPAEIPDDYHVLEVGSGTGSVTGAIAKRMNGRGHLDLWELSPEFCTILRQRIAAEKDFDSMRSRIKVHEGDVRDLPKRPKFNAIVSGLPFSNFTADEVEGFLEHFRALLKPGGTLIWFEYVALRRLQSPFVSKARRERLKGVTTVTRNFIHRYHYKQEIISLNLPPARILQLKFG
ncbi:MAG TPA: methyltransferase domain-containing protein [Planctomycetota bacterium]|jgi:phospholipid N-methyltransferase